MSDQKQTAREYDITVDRNLCCAYGVCAEICPEVFGLDDEGLVVLLKNKISDDLFEQANEAAYGCPQSVIKIEKQIV